MNYMKQVAQMLGVEIGESFRIEKYNGVRFRLFEGGLFYYDDKNNECGKSLLINDILIGKYEIVKLPKQILDDIEKEYLGNVIKPFRKDIKCIVKKEQYEYEYIVIIHENNIGGTNITLLFFENGTMYKGMELNKEYTLDDLGL